MNAPYVSKKQTTYLVCDYGLKMIKVLDKICDNIQKDSKQLALVTYAGIYRPAVIVMVQYKAGHDVSGQRYIRNIANISLALNICFLNSVLQKVGHICGLIQ